MAQAAHVPAREPVSRTLRGAVRLEPRPQTLSSRAALLYGRFYHSFITRLEVKERHGLRIAPDTTITLCAELAVARYQESDFTVDVWYFRTNAQTWAIFTNLGDLSVVPRTRPPAIPRWGVRRCTDSGWSLPTLERQHRMTVRRRTWETAFLAIRGERGAIQRGCSAPSRFPVGIRQDPREHGQRVPRPALAAPQADARTCFWYDRSNGLSAIQAVATMVLQGWRRVVLALVVRPRQSGNGYRPACPCSGRRGVPRSPQCGPGMRTTYQQAGDFRIRTSTSGHQVAAHVQGHSVTVFP